MLTKKAPINSLMLLLFLGFAFACSQPPLIEDHINKASPEPGTTGKVTDNHGEAASGSYVYAYRSLRSNLRGPADFEARVGSDGNYFLDVVEGEYYLVARLRHSGADAGPLKSGDAWALPTKNPVAVKASELTSVDFILQGIAQPMLMREGTLTSGDTGFTGLLLDADDQPLPGAFIIAYPAADYQRVPEATSPSVGEDGRFRLYVERTGRWCLAARTRPVANRSPVSFMASWELGNSAAVTQYRGKLLMLERFT